MATAAQLKALTRSVVLGDETTSRDLLRQVAAKASSQGKGRLAESINAILDEPKTTFATRFTTQPGKFYGGGLPQVDDGLLREVDTQRLKLRSLICAPDQQERIQRILHELRHFDELAHHDLRPTRKLLLYGAPGTGKSMTAKVVASELGLPLLRINLYALFSKHFGETAARLQKVFDIIAQRRAVYLFDEFDAIASSRQTNNEVGEMGRVVNALLQMIEDDDSYSVIIAATNFTNKIDSAFARRFDDIVRYGLPDIAQIESLLTLYIGRDISHLKLADSFGGLSHAEIMQICNDLNKRRVLGLIESVSKNAIGQAIRRRLELRDEIG